MTKTKSSCKPKCASSTKSGSKKDATACSVSGCSCTGYSQPDTGSACKSCGHYSGKHTG